MLYPIATESRVVVDLNGVWKFMIDKEVEPIETSQPLPTKKSSLFLLHLMTRQWYQRNPRA